MSYSMRESTFHKKTLAVVVADVEVDDEYQFERRWYGSNPEQLQLLAEWLTRFRLKLLSPLSVRSNHGFWGRPLAIDDLKNLAQIACFSVRSQSAFARRLAENRKQHGAGCSHAIIADTVGIKLKRQLDIAVTKQSLHSFWIDFDPDEERCKTSTLVESKPCRWIDRMGVWRQAIKRPLRWSCDPVLLPTRR